MKIDILELSLGKVKDISFEGVIEVSREAIEKSISKTKFDILSPVNVSGRVTLEDGVYRLEGCMELTAQFICDRCLNEFVCDMEIDFTEEFKRGVGEDDEDFLPIVKDQIDLYDDVLMKNIMLNIPVKLLCSEECSGIDYSLEISEEERKANSSFSVLENMKL